MELKGVTQQAVADEFVISQPSVAGWIKTGRIDKKHLTHLVEYFSDKVGMTHWGLPATWRPGSGLDPDEFSFVRRADVSFANGVGKVAYTQDDKPPLVFRTDFLRKLGVAEGKAVVVDADGASNLPKIPEGAVVLVNTGDNERLDGDFFAFRVGEDLLIKRLQMLDEIGVLATAENPDFKPKQKVYRPGDDDFEVIGRAVWAGSRL